MLVTNTTTGHQEGLNIGQTNTVLSGGTHSTTLTLDDSGATFANNGSPSKVTGVADGTSDYDAVNYHQFKKLENSAFAGSANAAALAALPPVAAGKTFSVGAGYGNYKSQNAVAVGARMMIGSQKNVGLSGGVGVCDSEVTTNAGVNYSW